MVLYLTQNPFQTIQLLMSVSNYHIGPMLQICNIPERLAGEGHSKKKVRILLYYPI